jgi:hypothetical protein
MERLGGIRGSGRLTGIRLVGDFVKRRGYGLKRRGLLF